MAFTKNYIPWNKGLKGYTNSGSFKKNDPNISDKNAYRWLGDNVGYAGVHTWVYKNLGKAIWCTWCFSLKNIQWANISQKYKRDLSDWIQLCGKCHSKYDNSLERSWETRRQKYGISGRGQTLRV
jgi:hypothetical protein